MNLFVLIPAYNEAATIANVLDRVLALPELPIKIIVIDDGSSDATVQVVESAITQHPGKLYLIRHTGNVGYGQTIRDAIAQVPLDDAFVPILSDGCDDVTLLPAMFALLTAGADIVCASRYTRGGQRRGGSLIKGVASRGYNMLLQKLTSCPTNDLSNSYKLIRKRVTAPLRFESKAFELFVEIILKAHLQGRIIREMPTIWQERRNGYSTFRLRLHSVYYMRWLSFALRHFLRKRGNGQ